MTDWVLFLTGVALGGLLTLVLVRLRVIQGWED